MQASTTSRPRAFRADIQALRALAVVGVILYHFWPQRLPGGYAGVDVFFVISGFLITSHLWEEIARTGTVNVLNFWARRIRRLLPAALLVIAVTALATVLWVPRTFWKQYSIEAIASATYWQNWRLAADSVDYLGAENVPSAFQHYWSLSVEEQFYIVWPLLMVLALVVARRRLALSNRGLVVGMLSAVVIASFTWSAWAVSAGEPTAYFATQSRAWEFGLGGLLALVPALWVDGHRLARALISLGGWVAIGATFVLYSQSTPFPGVAALLPVAGTAAVIYAADNQSFARLTGSKPALFLGDNSYSLYLWHWPVIVIAPFALGRELDWQTKVVLLAVVILGAVASRKFVEDPVRFSRSLSASRARVYLGAAAASGAIVVLGIAGVVSTDRAAQASDLATEALLEEAGVCLGAASVLEDPKTCDNSELGDTLLPAPGTLKDDTGGAYSCYEYEPTTSFSTCSYGSQSPQALRVAITGDSHAASLVPGLRPLLEASNWHLDVFVGRGCEWAPTTPDDPCFTYRTEVNNRLTSGDYDYILVTEQRSIELRAGDADPRIDSLLAAWGPALDAGSTVVAIADDPSVPEAALLCLESAADYDAAVACTFPEADAWKFSDPVLRAGSSDDPRLLLVDLAGAYCIDGQCPMVVGHVGVYRDTHHITATFSKTLGPYIIEAIANHAKMSPAN